MINEKQYKNSLLRRFFVRFHMGLILMATVLSGLVFAKGLLLAGLDSMMLRYPLVVILSYLCFFGCIRIWLLYIASAGHPGSTVFDGVGDILGTSDLAPVRWLGRWHGGGGRFGGGGASGSFGEATKGSSDVLADAGGSLLEDGAKVLVPLMLLVAVIFGAAVYVLYQAPFILSEAAFNFMLAGTMLKRTRTIDRPDWTGSIVKNTWIPFAVTLLVSGCIAALLHHFFPEANKITEIFR